MKKIIACFCRGGNPLNYLCAVLLALALAPSAFGAPQYKAALTVQGYSGSSTLEDFPVLVRLSPQTIDGFSYSACAQNGSDISFVAADGETLLPYDIDTWDTTGTSLIWVKVPQVASSGTTFSIRWGDDTPPANTPADTWSAYNGVWHMNEADAKDSTANQHNGTADPAVTTVAAKLGSGANFPASATSSTSIKTADCPNSDFASAISFEAWACPANVKEERALFGKDSLATLKFKDGTTWFTTPSCLDFSSINARVEADTWYHLVIVFVPKQCAKLYVNGDLAKTQSDTKGFSNTTKSCPIILGGNQWNAQFYKGILDECRLSAAELSADWINAEYANTATDTFIAYGAAQTGGDAVRVKGSPSEIGAPSPAYGFSFGHMNGDPLSFSIADTVVAGDGTSTNYLSGWLFEAVDTETRVRTPIASSEDTGAAVSSYSGTFASYSEFTWLWEKRDAFGITGDVMVAANGGSYLDVAVDIGLGYAPDASATLTVEYGTTSDSLDKNVSKAVSEAGSAIVRIPRLQPNTPYFFKATLDDGNGALDETAVTQLTTSGFSTGKRRIEYVEGTGTQWVDTGYTPTPSTRTVMDFQFTDTTVQARVFGIGIGDLIYTAYINGNGYYGYSLANTGTWMAIDALNRVDRERHLYDFNYIDGNDNHAYTVYSTNGTSLTVSPLEGTATKTATYTLPLGAWRYQNSADTPCNNISKHRIYSARIYEGDELKFALSPIASDSGDVMFYDSVSKRIFVSAGIKQNDLPYTIGGPSVSASLAVENDERVIALSFLAAPMDRPLLIAYGPEFAGDDPADWATTEAVATVPAGATSATVPLPATWGDDDALVARCYFDDGTDFPLWSDTVVWSDDTLPVLDNIAVDGTGGDTLVVSGTLQSFPGDDCTITVHTGASADSLTETWSELPGSVMTEAGNFSLTLYENDTTSSRYITPGSTVFVSIQASSGGKVARTPVISVQTKGAPVFGATSNDDLNNITFTGNLSGLGAGGSAVVTLYVGTANNADSLEAVETPKKITGTSNFTFTHAFPELDKTYYWQFRAVSTTAGGTPRETRSAVKSCRQNEKATYTWKADGNGNWNGDWEDPAHWSANMSPNKGYPQSSGSIAQFANCTLEHPVTVNVNGKYSLSRLRFWGSDNGSKIVFAGTGRDASGFTSGYDQSAVASNTEVEFRDMTLNASGDWEVLRNTAKTNVTFRVVRSEMAVGKYFALSANTCRLEVLEGSEFIAPGKLNMGGRGTVMVVDDSTVTAASAGMGIIFNADVSEKGEIEVRLRGRNAKINAGSFYTYSATSGQFGARVILEVPKEGFASAPIEMTSTKKFCEDKTGSGKTIIFEVDAKSPALAKSNRLLENMVVLDSTKPGGIASGAVPEYIGVVPSRNGKSSGAFKFDDTASPKKILLDLQGFGAVRGTMILVR